MTATNLDLLRDKIYDGGKVTLKEWIAARTETAKDEQALALEAEFAALQAERDVIVERQATLDALRAEITSFEADRLEPLRDAYAAYVQSREELVRELDQYVGDRWALEKRAADFRGDVVLPPELNRWAILNIADQEAQGGAVAPHVLHRPGGLG